MFCRRPRRVRIVCESCTRSWSSRRTNVKRTRQSANAAAFLELVRVWVCVCVYIHIHTVRDITSVCVCVCAKSFWCARPSFGLLGSQDYVRKAGKADAACLYCVYLSCWPRGRRTGVLGPNVSSAAGVPPLPAPVQNGGQVPCACVVWTHVRRTDGRSATRRSAWTTIWEYRFVSENTRWRRGVVRATASAAAVDAFAAPYDRRPLDCRPSDAISSREGLRRRSPEFSRPTFRYGLLAGSSPFSHGVVVIVAVVVVVNTTSYARNIPSKYWET